MKLLRWIKRHFEKWIDLPCNRQPPKYQTYSDLAIANPFYAYAFNFPSVCDRARWRLATDWKLRFCLSRIPSAFHCIEVPPNLLDLKGYLRHFFSRRRYQLKVSEVFSSEDLSESLLEFATTDEEVLITLVIMESSPLVSALAIKYELPPEIVKYLLEEDLKIFKSLLSKRQASSRVEFFAERAIKRFDVHYKNDRALKDLVQRFTSSRNSYFDVGCLFGLSLISADGLGFNHVHGCEVDRKTFRRARGIRSLAATKCLDLQYHESDLLDMEVKAGFYDLITVNNVLEHTSNLERTIEQLATMLSARGVCYIYQGNNLSPNFVRFEPHYKLPLLSLLPREEVIEILIRLGRISSDEDYVVVEWPTFRYLNERFAAYNLKAQFYEESLGYWGRSAIPSVNQVMVDKVEAIRAWEVCISPVLNQSDKQRHLALLHTHYDMCIRTLSTGSVSERVALLKPTWDIVVKYAE